MPDLIDLIAPETVLVRPDARDSAGVIAALAATLEAAGAVTAGFGPAALERESSSPTGLDLGAEVNAAIPHAEREHVLRPAVGIAVLETPVPFARMDDPSELTPVRVVVMPALADSGAQIDALRKIAGLLQNRALLVELAGAESPEAVIAALRAESAA